MRKQKPISENRKPTFERFADATLDAVRATYAQRGEEYADSWDLNQFSPHYLRVAIDVISGERPELAEALKRLSVEDLRLFAVSSMLDVKLSRMGGGYKKDTHVDKIAYEGFFVGAVDEYQNLVQKPFKKVIFGTGSGW